MGYLLTLAEINAIAGNRALQKYALVASVMLAANIVFYIGRA
jgi:hypothetical protein